MQARTRVLAHAWDVNEIGLFRSPIATSDEPRIAVKVIPALANAAKG